MENKDIESAIATLIAIIERLGLMIQNQQGDIKALKVQLANAKARLEKLEAKR